MRDECSKCELYKGCRSPFMEGSGPSKPNFLIVGEAPGADEDAQGEPFVGRSGKLLREMLDAVDIPVNACRFTNVVRCRPPDNAKPSARQVAYCSGLLEQEITNCEPKVVMLLGNVPLKAVLGEYGITEWNGVVVRRDNAVYIPAFHPSYILRGQTDKFEPWSEAFGKAYDEVYGTAEPTADADAEYIFPKTAKDFTDMMSDVLGIAHTVAFDTEVASKHVTEVGNKVLSVSIGIMDGDTPVAWSYPIDHRSSDVTAKRDDVIEATRTILDAGIPIVGHNVRFDQRMTRGLLGIDFQPTYDTMLISQLIDSRPGIHSLKRLAGVHLGMYDYDKELRDYVTAHKDCDPTRGGSYRNVPLGILLPYGGKDAIATIMLLDVLLPQIDKVHLGLLRDLIMPASNMLGHMESNGMRLDKRVIDRYMHVYSFASSLLIDELRQDRDVKRYVSKRRTGKIKDKKADKKFEFNPRSSEQLGHVLFNFKRYPIVARTDKKKPSCSADALKNTPGLSDDPFYQPLRLYKLYESMISKYLRHMCDGDWEHGDDRVHGSFNIGGARTGRLSSSEPNMQNIPTPEKEPGTLLAYMPIKNAFTHTWEGGCIASVDYSGMELRVIASVAHCGGMIKAFADGLDIHTYVTSLIFGVPYDEVTKVMRYRGKWCNWTFLYGGDAHTLHRIYGLPLHEAEEIRTGYYRQFSEILDYQEDTKDFLKLNGYVVTPFGNKIYIPEIYSPVKGIVSAAERTGVNAPIQGTASHITLAAGVVIHDQMQIRGMKTMLVNTVHDSLVGDVYPGEVDQWITMCVDSMENIPTLAWKYFPSMDFSWLTVPLVADADVGSHYGTLTKYEVKA